jgi:hypothetical protein
MANRANQMSYVMGLELSRFTSPKRRLAPTTPRSTSVERNEADDKVFAVMHRNKANFSVEKVGAAFANIQRRKVG